MDAGLVQDTHHPTDVGKLRRIVLLRGITILAILALILFVPAGTAAYWEAWVYLAVISLPASFVLLYFLRTDPSLIERRMRMKEKEPEQKAIMKFSYFAAMSTFLVPGFDERFGWSAVPFAVVLAADLMVLAGYMLFVAVLKTNRYASRIIEVEPGQKLVASGPYAVVRHPMYVGALCIYLCTPLALGSYWALIPSASIIAILVARILNEEQVLNRDLEGYREYTHKTRYRLIPGVW